MQRIREGRRNVFLHSETDLEDLPVEGVEELPAVGSEDGFVPVNMDDPTLYPGDVLFGVTDGYVEFAELLYDTVDGGVLVLDLETGRFELRDHQEFSSRFFVQDEIHAFGKVVTETTESDVEFTLDELEVEEPERDRL